MIIELHWGYLVIIILSFIVGKFNTKYTCLAYILPCIYFIERILVANHILEEGYAFAYSELMMFIGMLHFMEGILTFFFGSKRSEVIVAYQDEKIAGGYQFYGKWIMPLFIFSIKGIYIPLVSMIMYYDQSFTHKLEDKSEKMGLAISLYGLMVLAARELMIGHVLSMSVVMLIIPFLHEMLFVLNVYLERGEDLYTYPKKGLRLMAFAELSNMPYPFERGDVFLQINGEELSNETEYEAKLMEESLLIKVLKLDGDQIYILIKSRQLKQMSPIFLPPE